MLPFGAVLIEYYFILSAIWLHHFYYLYGFLLLVTFLLTLTCIEVSIVAVYFHLAAEDYRWWWCAFFSTGSSGLYFFAYAIVFFSTQLSIPYFISTFYYFVYMATVSINSYFIFSIHVQRNDLCCVYSLLLRFLSYSLLLQDRSDCSRLYSSTA